MITLKNPEAVDNWFIDLKEDNRVEGVLPLNGLNVRNDSNIVAWVDLDGLKVGEVQRYSADLFQGRNFDEIRVYNPDGQEFAANDLFLQATKGENMGSQPFNPQWDMMFNDMDRFSTGTNARVSLSNTITTDMIKYIINVQNALVVQRRLDIQAHATLLGVYSITFGANDVLSGAVGIAVPPPPDTMLYRKIIQGGVFDYAVTNCYIAGWIFDFKAHSRPAGTTSIATNPDNAIDGDMSTYADIETDGGIDDLWMITLNNALDVAELHFSGYIEDDFIHDGTAHHQILTSVNGTDWIERGASSNSAGGLTYFKHITGLSLSSITHVKIQGSNTWKTQQLYDVSIK